VLKPKRRLAIRFDPLCSASSATSPREKNGEPDSLQTREQLHPTQNSLALLTSFLQFHQVHKRVARHLPHIIKPFHGLLQYGCHTTIQMLLREEDKGAARERADASLDGGDGRDPNPGADVSSLVERVVVEPIENGTDGGEEAFRACERVRSEEVDEARYGTAYPEERVSTDRRRSERVPRYHSVLPRPNWRSAEPIERDE
jgi:hypothetical protein